MYAFMLKMLLFIGFYVYQMKAPFSYQKKKN